MSNNSQTDQPNNKISRITKSILIAIFAIIVVALIQNFSDIDFIEMFRSGNKMERVRKKFKESLYKQYGKEFVVNRIGTRSYNGRKMWEAQIYPKKYVGTQKEGDSYYQASAGMDMKSFGRLGPVGGGWANVEIKIEAEKFLKPKVKEIFGKRVLIKPEVKYKRKDEDSENFGWKIVSGFDSLLTKVKRNPDKHRIELTLYLYIFDRIDSYKEKEKRRKDIFEFVQYLKKEGLFRYLEMGVIFIDERVLAPSYEKYKDKMHDTEWVTRDIEGETIELPPDSFRTAMSKQLQSEIDTMNEKQLIEKMKEFRNCELSYKEIGKLNSKHISIIYSKKRLKETYGGDTKHEKELMKDYEDLNDIVITKNLEYVFHN